jgi:spermidine/putrescine transport system ATP-binding protein
MHLGQIQQVGRPREVYPRPSTLFVAGFVGASNRFPATVRAALPDGRYTADLAELGTWDVLGVPGLAIGADVVAIVRPEGVRPGGGTIAVDGTVADVSYLGPSVHLTVDADGRGLVCTAPGRSETAESATRFGWEPADVWLVPSSADGDAL